MDAGVKGGTRGYDNSARARSSGERQMRVARVAARLVVEKGYAAMTMADVAATAEVSVPWLYKAFGPKPVLVKRSYDVLLAGDPDPLPMAQRPAFRELAQEPDPRRAIALYSAFSRQLVARVGPLAAALLAAARSGDPELAGLGETLERERLFGAAAFADHLAELGALAPGLTPGEARDAVWALISPEVFRMLVLDRGWDLERYEHWLSRSLAGSILPA